LLASHRHHWYQAPVIIRPDNPGGSRRTVPRRFSVLFALLLLTVLQIAAVSHLVGHSAVGDTGNCEICLNATHGGDALVAVSAAPATFHACLGRLIVESDRQAFSRTPSVYRARGPPAFA
jgi:hypothetical protein